MYKTCYIIYYTQPSILRSECERFTRVKNNTTTCHPDDFSEETEQCSMRLFSDSVMRSTLATEWDLVCQQEWLLPLSQSVFFAGVLVGAPFWGHLADLLGRKITFLLREGFIQLTSVKQRNY